jgi:hypothetical protein
VLALLLRLLISIDCIRRSQLLDRNYGGFLHIPFNLYYPERAASVSRVRNINYNPFELVLLAPHTMHIRRVRQENVCELKPYVASLLRKTLAMIPA